MYKYLQIIACVLFCLNLVIFAMSDETTESLPETESSLERMPDDPGNVCLRQALEEANITDLYEHRARLAELVERVDTDNQIGYGPSQNPLGPVYSEKLRAFSLKKTARGIEDFL
ncbi:MAG: hypothetical protein AAFQ83_06850 [Bacteroidota bacterium]